MEYKIKIFILGLFLAGACSAYGQNSKSHRVLFLGNSEFLSRGGVCTSFEGFCQAVGLDFQAVSQNNSGSNPMGVEFLNFGRIPTNLPAIAEEEGIHELIRSGNFDYVVLSGKRAGFLLPDWVELPGNREKHISYEKNLEALAKIHQTIVKSGAKMVFYMEPGKHATLDIKYSLAQIYLKLHADLEKMEINGENHEVILVPGMLFSVDGLRRYGVDGWYVDHVHGTALSNYAMACMLYTYLTGNDPRDNDFRKLIDLTRDWQIIPDKIDSLVDLEDEKWIKDQVWLYYSTRPR